MADDPGLPARVAELERRLAAEVEARERLVEIATLLASDTERGGVLRTIVSAAADILDAETASLLLVDHPTGELRVAVATGASEADVDRIRIPAGRGIAGWTVEHREPAVVHDPRSDERFYDDVDAGSDFETESLVAVPVLLGDRAIGVLEVVNKLGAEPFGNEDLTKATAFATLAAVALDRSPP